jgi:hypothetical protein
VIRSAHLTIPTAVVESYSQISYNALPTVADLPVQVSKTRSGRGTFHNVPISASICLDFASPLSFDSDSTSQQEHHGRPAVILGPASTWHPEIGAAMAAQARARARELSMHIVWCDGGAGGQSGILGPSGDELLQRRHEGSWVKTVRLEHPFVERRTAYATLGNVVAFVVLCIGVPGAGPVFYGLRLVTQRGRQLVGRLRNKSPVVTTEQTPLLIDI